MKNPTKMDKYGFVQYTMNHFKTNIYDRQTYLIKKKQKNIHLTIFFVICLGYTIFNVKTKTGGGSDFSGVLHIYTKYSLIGVKIVFGSLIKDYNVVTST